MKKLLTLGSLAVLVALTTGRPADAWTNAKFSIGLNWSLQSGNNSFLWGAWRNGQIPEEYGQGGGYGPPPGMAPGMAPGAQPFPWFGNNSNGQPSEMPRAAMPTQPNYAAANNYGNFYPASYQTGYQSPYTMANYTPGYYAPNYYAPNYYMPGYGTQGYGADPFTWYYQR